MTALDWTVQIERIVLRGGGVSPERLEQIVAAVREHLRRAGLPELAADARTSQIPWISVSGEDDDQSLARAFADALMAAAQGRGGMHG